MDKKLITINFDSSPEAIFVKKIRKTYPTVQNPVEHWHNKYELFIILEGYCTFFVQNTLFYMDKGDICLVPPNCIHAMSYPNTFHEHMVVNFSGLYVDPMLVNDMHNAVNKGKYTPKPEDSAFFKEIYDGLYMHADSNEEYNYLYAKTYFDRLFIKMLRTREQFSKEVKNDSLSGDVARVLEYINHNYTQDITLVQMADYCHVSPSYFSKYFKKTIGLGFKEYLNYTRLTVAENLLRTTNFSISEVASESGFYDSNYFSLVFRQRYGVPPLRYRKNSDVKENIL